ncbi:MAG: alpha/beta fold hydrolase [Sandaracinaceae bacterium]|nr:alpha/beta fold hydrolase [Sandaracinaceae bacterium]
MRGSRWRRFAIAALALAGTCTALGASLRWDASYLFRAPNAERGAEPSVPPGGARTFHVAVGPPDAVLEGWIFEPSTRPIATVLVLHGVRGGKKDMIETARELTRAGMRAVLVDARGHGGSSGRFLTYGVREARDLSQVIDALEEDGITGALGVYGPSYGGAIAHQLAGRDARVHAIVTVAAMSDLRERARDAWPLGRWLPRAWIDGEVERAARHAGFEIDEANPARATAQSHAATLLFHGDADAVIAYEHGVRLQRACAWRGCRLERLRRAGHRDALTHPSVGPAARAFFRRELGPDRALSEAGPRPSHT